MRLSDLLDREVIGETGKKLGRVHEVRAIQTGPLQDAFGAALTIEGVIVGRGSLGTRLGFDRTDVKSPAAVRWVFEGIKGDRLFIPWNQIVAIHEDGIHIAGTAEEFGAPDELASSAQVDTRSEA
jgi:sporulation protein YlmC with PRC-barrel domain